MPVKFPVYKILFLCFFFLPLITGAQTFRYSQYTTHQGLPIDNVYAAAQDGDGFIWFGTDFGISRFDGYRFINYSKSNGIANKAVTDIVYAGGDSLLFLSYPFSIQSIKYNNKGQINTIVENATFALQQLARHGQQYYCYQRGLGRYGVLEKGQFRVFDADSVFGMKGVTINAVLSLENNGIAFCTGKGLFVKNGANIVRIISDRNVQNAVYTKEKTLLAVCDGKLMRSDRSLVFTEMPFSFPANFTVYHAAQENDEAFWFRGIDKGVYRLFNDKLEEMSERLGMQNKAINEFFNDTDGNFWFCTDGAGIIEKKKTEFITYETQDGLANNKILQLLKQNDQLLIGTSNGLSVMNNKHITTVDLPQNGEGLKYVFRLFPVSSTVVGICMDKTFTFRDNDNMATYNSYVGDFNYDGHQFRAFKFSFAWQQDERNIWMVQIHKLIHLQKDKSEIIDLSPYKVRKGYCMTTYDNRLWLGTDAGIIFIDSNNKISKTDSVAGEKIGPVFDFLTDKENRLWIATEAGLFVYEHKKFTAIEKGPTLGSNYCRDITIDGSGKIWVATWDGIFYFDGKTKKYFNTNDGLPSKTVNSILFDSTERQIYIGTENGLAVLGMSSLSNALSKRKIFISCSIAGNENEIVRDNEILKPSQNSLGFYLSFPYYRGTAEITYEYKMDDGQWVTMANPANPTASTNPTIVISDIGSGKHIFYARAKVNGEVISNDNASFVFSIKKAFYKTWWFWLPVILISQLFIFWVINYYNKKAREEKLAEQSQKAEYASLKQQAFTLLMNPHFIFNALNSVQHYVNQQDRKSANKYLSDFATLIRRSFDAAQRSFVTLEEELETIRLYLQLEKMRFTDKFDYSITVSKATDDDDWMLPSMMLQPFLENAVLHGLMPLSGKGLLTIDASVLGNSLCIIIKDNGIGIEKSKALRSGGKHNSKGMQLIKERIELLSKLSKEPIQLFITELNPVTPNPGTKITMIIPQEVYEVFQKQRNQI